jgi:hypothetical protein
LIVLDYFQNPPKPKNPGILPGSFDLLNFYNDDRLFSRFSLECFFRNALSVLAPLSPLPSVIVPEPISLLKSLLCLALPLLSPGPLPAFFLFVWIFFKI